MKAVCAFRTKLGRCAELCVLPQEARLLQFLQTTGRAKPAVCVWNCPRAEEITDLKLDRKQEHRNDLELIIYYHGSITSTRLPPALVIAASRFRGRVRMRVAGYEAPGSIGYVKELTKLAAQNGAADIIEHLGTIPLRRDLLRNASKAHVGLSLMPKQSGDINMQHMVGASNKPFDYMACGLPLLVTDLPDWIATFVTPGYARSCDPQDPDSIEAALRWYVEHPAERREMGNKGQDKIRQSWNYETMFAGVLRTIENG
jgi:glycosyltransferase involved in cell wall biosynthesis